MSFRFFNKLPCYYRASLFLRIEMDIFFDKTVNEYYFQSINSYTCESDIMKQRNTKPVIGFIATVNSVALMVLHLST